jgi:hypothetical protein
MLLSAGITGAILPPPDIKGLWFYSAAAALLLGEYLVEPYFSRPADAIANAVALGLALASAGSSNALFASSEIALGRALLGVYSITVLLLGVAAIAWKDSGDRRRRVARAASRSVATFGRAKWMFSVAFFAAAYIGYSDDPASLAILYFAWFVIVALRPVEGFMQLLPRVGRDSTRAEVVRLLDPNIAVLRLPTSFDVRLGDGVTLDGSISGTVVDITQLGAAPVARVSLSRHGTLALSNPTVEITRTRDTAVVGYADAGTDLETVRVRSVPLAAERGLAEGRLLEIGIGGQKALYQIVAAEIEQQTEAAIGRQTVAITARKLGRWDPNTTTFEPVEWIPEPGASALLMYSIEVSGDPEKFIGHVPGTEFGIGIDPHTLVTHNTAILGILGAGKTHLAYELIWRMLSAGIKVIVLDITGKYSKHFERIQPDHLEGEIADRINSAIAADLNDTAVHDGEAGNVRGLEGSLKWLLDWFLASDSRLLVFNPNAFLAKRMEGRPFSGHASLLADVTMVEVTRLVAEHLLQKLQRADDQPEEGQARLCLVLEEAHSLVPEWNSATNDSDRQAVNGTARAILQGRKYGFGTILITQRTANVTKSILNQCNTVFGMRAFDATGMGFLENYVGPAYAKILASLRDRQAVVYGRASTCRAPLVIHLNDADAFDAAFVRDRLTGIATTAELPQQEERAGSQDAASATSAGSEETDVDF